MKKYIGLEEMSNGNCSSVLSVIRDCGEVSRKQISDITGLSWGGMTKIVNKLFEHEYIVEDKSQNVTGIGRIPNVIRINKEQNFVIGLDINRMGFAAYVMNLAGDIIKGYFHAHNQRKEQQSENAASKELFDNKEELLQAILELTRQAVDEYKEKKILAIGVAMQGILDAENGVSVKFPHCHDWKNVPIKEILEQEFGIEVFVEHDPNCMLYSVMSEEESENMLLLRLDSSVGMAASVNGSIIRGNGLLEVAHYIVVPEGKECRCGQRGCLEAYVSSCLVKGKLQEEELPELIKPMAIFMNNMIHMFNSDKIVLTGRLVKYRSAFEKELLEEFQKYCDKDVIVEFVEEAEHAVHGAALIAAQGAIEQLRL